MSPIRLNAYTVVATAGLAGCFGSPDFGADRAAARKFARALEDGDTVQMAALSLPVAASKMAAARRDLPPEYVAFARPTPEAVSRDGGKGYRSFFIPSTLLRDCEGGVLVGVYNDARPLVAWVRPTPPIDSADADPCRDIIARLPSRRR